jgi:glycosyltransferase involved in cell wall biosynthesis
MQTQHRYGSYSHPIESDLIHIGLNLLYLIPGHVGGTQTYAEELIGALARLGTHDVYTVFLNEEARDLALPPSFKRVICPVHAVRRAARYAYEQFQLPRLLRRHQIDVLHSPGYVCPLRVPCANVVTICDLNYLALKEVMSRSKRAVLGRFVIQSARRSDHIITLSEFSKNQILSHLKVPADKVTPIHLGPKALPEASSTVKASQLLRNYDIRGPFIIAFSSQLAHKNIRRLVEAFAVSCRDTSHHLVLVGHLPEGIEIHADIARLGLQKRVRTTGYVPEAHVMPLLEQAELFVFPSLYEGFGLPVLDAQQAGVAVACSTAASLPEVAGDGAALFDPTSVAEMAAVLSRCLHDAELRRSLVAKGYANLARFSWEKTASETQAVYRAILQQASIPQHRHVPGGHYRLNGQGRESE